MADQDLAGKVSLITGSGRGIGRAIAMKLGEMGSKVAVSDLPQSTEAFETVKEITGRGGEAMLASADVTDLPGEGHDRKGQQTMGPDRYPGK